MNTKNWTDEEMIRALRQGDPDRRRAWEHIYKTWRDAWVGAVIKCGGTPDEADEALHSVAMPFERVVAAEGFMLERAKLRTYLVACVLRIWARQHKKVPSTPVLEGPKVPEGMIDSVEKAVMRTEMKAAVDDLINVLGERCRRVLRMFGLNYSMEEIAEAEGWKDADKAKKEKYECQNKLKEHLRKDPALAKRLKELRND